MPGSRVVLASQWAVVVAAASLLAAAPAAATTFDVPGDFDTIQEAIDHAAPGDTVLVGPDTYVENLLLTEGIVVRSSGGPAATTIDGGSAGPVASFIGAAGAVLEGFTVTHGFGCAVAGGGIHASGSTGRISGCIITGNFSSSSVCAGSGNGGGIYLEDSEFEIEGNSIVTNFCEGDGAGIALHETAGAEITNNVIIGNEVTAPGGDGGGIYVAGGVASVTIAFNVVAANVAEETTGKGAGIFCGAFDALLDHNTVVDNGWVTIGAAWVTGGGGPHSGVGIFLTSGFASLKNNIVGTIETGFPVPGTGVHCTESAFPLFSHNDVWMNPFWTSDPAYGGTCGDQTGENGNISADPLFCGFFPHDYSLSFVSPCHGTGEGGTNMGARDVECEAPTAVQPSTWGALKTRFGG